MSSIAGRHVFLSASFPSGERGKEVWPFDASAIADAVTAVVRAVLANEGKLLIGGHPTITPLVLMIGKEVGAQKAVDVFQSKWFRSQIPEETEELGRSGVGTIHLPKTIHPPEHESRDESLQRMRKEMLKFGKPVGAVFVGGMSGIWDEYALVANHWDDVPLIPIAGPGGATAFLTERPCDLPPSVKRSIVEEQCSSWEKIPSGLLKEVIFSRIPRELVKQKIISSRHYPFVASTIVKCLDSSKE